MPGCEGRDSYLEKFLWGEATPEEVAKFESHSAGCVSCREAFGAAAFFDGALKGALPAMASQIGNPREAVLEKITIGNLMNARPPSWKTIRWRAVRWVLLFGLLATLAVSFEGFVTVALARKKMLRELCAAEVKTFGSFIQRHDDPTGISRLGAENSDMVADLVTYWSRRGFRRSYPFDEDRVVDGQALDPWDKPYVYQSTGDSFVLYSLGENGRDDQGGGDDVTYSSTLRARGG